MLWLERFRFFCFRWRVQHLVITEQGKKKRSEKRRCRREKKKKRRSEFWFPFPTSTSKTSTLRFELSFWLYFGLAMRPSAAVSHTDDVTNATDSVGSNTNKGRVSEREKKRNRTTNISMLDFNRRRFLALSHSLTSLPSRLAPLRRLADQAVRVLRDVFFERCGRLGPEGRVGGSARVHFSFFWTMFFLYRRRFVCDDNKIIVRFFFFFFLQREKQQQQKKMPTQNFTSRSASSTTLACPGRYAGSKTHGNGVSHPVTRAGGASSLRKQASEAAETTSAAKPPVSGAS